MAHEEAPDSHPLILADEKGQIVVQPKTRLEPLDSDVRSPSREPTRQPLRTQGQLSACCIAERDATAKGCSKLQF
eukprot:symbB.v1.2.037339.t1/scaffold5436.1/size50838/3